MRNPVSIGGPRNPVTIRGSRNPVTLSGSKNPVTDNGSRNPVTFVTPVPFTGVDPDAASFFTRAGITDPTQQNAINDLVIQLKNAGIWNSFVALYPFVGGTAATHSHNLKSSSFQITWNGTVTHNANGVQGNGTTGYGDPGITPSTSGLLLNSTHGGCYINQVENTAKGAQFGGPSLGTLDQFFQLTLQDGGANFFYDCYGTATGRVSGTAQTTTGFYVGSRTSSNASAIYRNGVSAASGAGASETLCAGQIFILARNQGGTPGTFSDGRYALFTFGLGLSAAEMTAFNAAVQTFQTALSRA